MAKRQRGITPKKIDKWEKEGRGKGLEKNYKPWLTTQDVSSQGRSHRTHGNLTDRQHDLLSDLEQKYLFIVEFVDCVVDIKEQYPLPLEVTEFIAKELGVKHHTDPKTKCHQVVTTDFVIKITNDDGEFSDLARTIKYREDLFDKRQMEKFEIERRYWEQKGINWGIVTENEIPEKLAQNIADCYKYVDLSDLDSFKNITQEERQRLVDSFKFDIIGNAIVIREKATQFDNAMVLLPGTGLSIFRHLVITKQIKINLFEKINVDIPQEVSLNENGKFNEVTVI